MSIPNKVPSIPSLFFNQVATIKYKGELNRYGEYTTTDISYRVKFHQQTKRILDAEHNLITIVGCVLIDGLNNIGNPIDCDITINNMTYKIYSIKGITNPDGTIHHYKMELI